MYSKQDPPTNADKMFVNTPYDITKETGTSVAFNWGEVYGPEQVTAKVTFSDNTTQAASLNFNVVAPGCSWTLTADKKTAIIVEGGEDILAYGHPELGRASAGIIWDVSATAPGQLDTVQIMKGAFEELSTDPTHPPIRSLRSMAQKDPTTGVVTDAPFPLVDIEGPGTSPLYGTVNGGSDDSPRVPLLWPGGPAFNAKFQVSFKDTEMYQPPGGIWVPVMSWTWSVDATATIASGAWVATDVTPPGTTTPVGESTYPTWNDSTVPYTGWV